MKINDNSKKITFQSLIPKLSTDLLFMMKICSAIEETCSIPDNDTTVMLYIPGDRVTMWLLFTDGIVIDAVGSDTRSVTILKVILHRNASVLTFQKIC